MQHSSQLSILLATVSYWPNIDGGAVFERRLVRALAARGHRVSVVAPSPTGRAIIQRGPGYSIYRPASYTLPPMPQYSFSPWPKEAITRAFRENKPQVLHIHNPFLEGLAALRLAKKYGVATVGTSHNMRENTLLNLNWLGPAKSLVGNAFDRFQGWFYQQMDQITAPTQTAVDILQQRSGLQSRAQDMKAISNGLDIHRFRPRLDQKAALRQQLGWPLGKSVVLYTGRLDGEKNMWEWIKMIPEVLKRAPKTHFVIGGRGNQRAGLERWIDRQQLREQVTFLGFVEDDLFPLVYSAADFFVITSKAELQSIVTLEAIASGLPIVGANAAALPELVQPDNGFLYQPGNMEELSGAVSQLALDGNLRMKMGRASRQLSEQHDFQRTVDQYEALYLEVKEKGMVF